MMNQSEYRTKEQRLLVHLLKIVLWEAKLVETDKCWQNDLPQLNQELYDEWIELQKERNELLGSEGTHVAMEAVEKQTPKKIICEVVDELGDEYEFEHYICPNCKDVLHQRYKKSKEPMRYKQKYCHECGQKLDWEDENL